MLQAITKFHLERAETLLDDNNIEDKIMHKLELNISDKQLKKDINQSIPREMMSFTDIKDWIAFLESIFDSYNDIYTNNLTKKKADRIERTKRKLKEIR